MDDARARLVVLLLGAPEVLERGERRENRTTNPDGVLPLGWSDDLDLEENVESAIDIVSKFATTCLHA